MVTRLQEQPSFFSELFASFVLLLGSLGGNGRAGGASAFPYVSAGGATAATATTTTTASTALHSSSSGIVTAAVSSICGAFPFKPNPLASVPMILVLAFVPHFIRIYYTTKALKGYYVANKDKGTADPTPDNTDVRRKREIAIRSHPTLGPYIGLLTGCHTNGLEAFSYYSSAVALCAIAKVDRAVLGGGAGLFLVLRTAYTIVYISRLNDVGRGKLRQAVFAAALTLALGLTGLAAEKYEHY